MTRPYRRMQLAGFARRMSFATCSVGAFVVPGPFLMSTSMRSKDEPQTLR
jgi:hypothetical protein